MKIQHKHFFQSPSLNLYNMDLSSHILWLPRKFCLPKSAGTYTHRTFDTLGICQQKTSLINLAGYILCYQWIYFVHFPKANFQLHSLFPFRLFLKKKNSNARILISTDGKIYYMYIQENFISTNMFHGQLLSVLFISFLQFTTQLILT